MEIPKPVKAKALAKIVPPVTIEALVPTFIVHFPKRAAQIPPEAICKKFGRRKFRQMEF